MASKKTSAESYNGTLSNRKKTLFYLITFSIPVLFFLILEVSLRIADYKGNNDLFIDPGIPDVEFLYPNPNFASRYFFYTNTVPSPSMDMFEATKPADGFRVFAMGGSSAAGYPYGFNGTYSRVVNDVLQDALPNRTVEVVNVGVSAISTYTLFDQVDEIIDQKPDAILIYAGHNEFYGALGVGSNENLGGFPGFVRFYLKMQRLKTFMLLRTVIVDSGKWFAETFGDSEYDASATLMERIVDSRSIELGSPKYELAMIQFQSNLDAIISKYQRAGIPVFIGSVASNLKDHPPFVDIQDGEQPSAQVTYDAAQQAFENREYDTAHELFTTAKDLDGLKFRAPSQINEIIRQTTEANDLVYYVPSEEELTRFTYDGIIGFDLMLEHLHPNQRGYFIIGKSFAASLLEHLKIPQSQLPHRLNDYFDEMYFTEFDHRVAHHRVETLKQGFPFVMGEKPTPYQIDYDPISIVDSLAFRTVHFNLSWDKAKVHLADIYERSGQKEKAVQEYLGLIRNQPWNESPYIFASRIYLDRNDFDSAEPLLRTAYELNPRDAFITKMLGAIEVQNGNAADGIQFLEESRRLNPNDPQMLYNLSGAYGINKQFNKALEIALQVRQINPRFPGNDAWIQQLQTLSNQ